MRRLTVTTLALLAVLALLGAAAPPGRHSGPPVAAYRAQNTMAKLAVQVEPPGDSPARHNFATTTYLHFGNPAAGIAVLETWIRVTYDDGGLPLTNQAGCRGIRARNVARIALRCILHTRGGTNSDDATGPTVNSGDVGNPVLVSTASPTISAGYNPGTNTTQFCRSWSEVRYTIRWTDGTVSLGKVLVAPSTLFNTRCFFLGGP